MNDRRAQFTGALAAAEGGDRTGLDALLPTVYDELRRLAGAHMRRERGEHTLQATALAHEAFLRLADGAQVRWRGRAQFLAVAARAMRQILVDHARRRGSRKRGGGAARVPLSDTVAAFGRPDLDVLAVHEALEDLAARDPRKARVVELRFFGGMTGREAAEVLGIAESTADDEWAFSRAWLRRRLND